MLINFRSEDSAYLFNFNRRMTSFCSLRPPHPPQQHIVTLWQAETIPLQTALPLFLLFLIPSLFHIVFPHLFQPVNSDPKVRIVPHYERKDEWGAYPPTFLIYLSIRSLAFFISNSASAQ